MLAISIQDLRPYWHMFLPFLYAVVSGAVRSFSVLFAKSMYASAYHFLAFLRTAKIGHLC